MHLWTDYEGNTLAGYPLGRLNRSEGRNAFFPTATPDGQRSLLRLTEAHFDEAELIGRWRLIAAVSHPNLQAIKRAGQTTFDGLSLACCLLEHTDSSLSDALREQILSVDETKEVAEAVSGALAALHAAGLIHEHVDATNVFASGEVIKLRSDCCRECVGEFEADTPEAREALRQRDLHDLGLLLLRCLGLDSQGHLSTRLPKPFDRIIPGALNGTLRAEDIVGILQPPKQTVASAPQQVPAAATIPQTAASMSRPAASLAKDTEPAIPHRVASPSPQDASTHADEPMLAHNRLPFPETDPDSDANVSPTSGRGWMGSRLQMGLDGLLEQSRQHLGTKSIGADLMRRLRPMKPRSISRKTYIAWGAAAAMLGVVIWTAAGGKHEAKEPEASPQHAAIVEGQPAASQAKPAPQPQPKPTAVAEAHPTQNSLLASGERAGWHVIAYTYMYEQQAQAQVMKLQRKYVSLHPQVFTPTGHAPYFVALGNPSNETTAMDLRNRARQVGLPRDTYARNF